MRPYIRCVILKSRQIATCRHGRRTQATAASVKIDKSRLSAIAIFDCEDNKFSFTDKTLRKSQSYQARPQAQKNIVIAGRQPQRLKSP